MKRLVCSGREGGLILKRTLKKEFLATYCGVIHFHHIKEKALRQKPLQIEQQKNPEKSGFSNVGFRCVKNSCFGRGEI